MISNNELFHSPNGLLSNGTPTSSLPPSTGTPDPPTVTVGPGTPLPTPRPTTGTGPKNTPTPKASQPTATSTPAYCNGNGFFRDDFSNTNFMSCYITNKAIQDQKTLA